MVLLGDGKVRKCRRGVLCGTFGRWKGEEVLPKSVLGGDGVINRGFIVVSKNCIFVPD